AIWSGGSLGLNGNSFLIDGHDHAATAPYDTLPGALQVPAVLTEGPASDVPMTGNQTNNVSGSGGSGSVQHSVFTYDFNALYAQLSAMADNTLTGDQGLSGVSSVFGSLANPKVTV